MQTECLVDENGIELLVSYEAQYTPLEFEEGHGRNIVNTGYEIELKSIELVIAGTGIEILPKLNGQQKKAIIEKIKDL